MARIAGVNIPTAKKLEIALTSIYGIGRETAQVICAKAGVAGERRVHELTDEDIAKVREVIDKDYLVEGELRRDVAVNIKIWAVTAVCAIVKACPYAARARSRTREPARASARPWLTRRSK